MGRQVPQGRLAATKHSLLSCLITIGPKRARAKQQQKLFQQQEKSLAKEAAEAIYEMPAQVCPAAVVMPAQARSPVDIFSDVLPA